MLSRHKTTVVFWSVLLLSLASIALLFTRETWALLLLGVSMAFNIWSIIKSDNEGFVRTRQMRRAHEPPRHFNGWQLFAIFSLIIAQIGLGTYAFII